ncbi:MAG: LytTR family DNA-binding domain-containing protein [Eubacteriales bacterium]|nr:LytTR family DNA-binding domain-containing protein [Eubacteriales bacterium]
MKVRIEIDERLQEDELIIRCSQVDSGIIKLQEAVRDIGSKDWCMTLRMKDTEYYIPLDEILFFETEEKNVRAHTADKMFETSYKLYELEKMLPGHFMRISKSTIVNMDRIYSITRNLTASSVVEFTGSAKKVYVSRNYYKVLAERLGERRRRI